MAPARTSRRRFLTGALATASLGAGGLTTAGGALAGCGSGAPPPPTVVLVHLFSTNRVLAAGIPQRVPFAVVAQDGLDLPDQAELAVTIRHQGEVMEQTTVTGRVVNHDHTATQTDPNHQHANLLRYYAVRTTAPEPGLYDLEVDFGPAGRGQLPVQFFAPEEVSVILPGQPLPELVTPTVTDPAGVNPICTRAPEPCPFHTTTAAQAVADGHPVALLVATPALCRTAYCGPAVDTLMAEAAHFPAIVPIHLEFYANADEVAGNYDDDRLRLAPPVEALGLDFEPSLFLVAPGGTVVDRIDNLYDAEELRAALSTLTP